MIAIGGGMLVPDGRVPVHMDYALGLTGRPEPQICVVSRASLQGPPVTGARVAPRLGA